MAFGVLIMLFLVTGALALWKFYMQTARPPMEFSSPEETALPLIDSPSIAVLPFVNMSDDPKKEYFSDGLRGWFRLYNEQRPHQALKGKTPDEVYQQTREAA